MMGLSPMAPSVEQSDPIRGKPHCRIFQSSDTQRRMADGGSEGDVDGLEKAKLSRTRFDAYCSRCKRPQIFVERKHKPWLHSLLSIVTLGLWLPVWMAIATAKAMRPWRCTECGWHKPEFRRSLKDVVQMGEAAVRRRNPQRDERKPMNPE
jgi:hypothetical protein